MQRCNLLFEVIDLFPQFAELLRDRVGNVYLIEIINLSNRIVVMRDGQAIKHLKAMSLQKRMLCYMLWELTPMKKLKTNTQTKQRLVTLLILVLIMVILRVSVTSTLRSTT